MFDNILTLLSLQILFLLPSVPHSVSSSCSETCVRNFIYFGTGDFIFGIPKYYVSVQLASIF